MSADPDDDPSVASPPLPATAAPSSALPGAHRGGFRRLFTQPVLVAGDAHHESVSTAGTLPSVDPEAQWAPASTALPRMAGWALFFGAVGLAASFLVGWAFVVGLVGAGLAIAALRRPWESRSMAVWALCLSVASLAYSAGWLWWASTQGPLFG